jgi:outer membrane protein assembly factor BamE (lipoprotein component of BamABCDE complex)
MKRFLVLMSFVLALAACDAVQRQELQVGASKDAVLQQMGQPDTVWKEPDGRELWDYPRGPGGTETLRMTISSDGVLKDILNILTESNFANIQPGMNKEQVRRIIGRPGGQKEYGNAKGSVTWEYTYLKDRMNRMLFTVDFDPSGVVKGTATVDPQMIKPQ